TPAPQQPMMKKYLPDFLKPAIRYVYYRQQRAKVAREPGIRRKQDELIKQFDPSAERLIVYLVEGADWDTGIDKISGGIISIVSFCEESRALRSLHGAEVIMCTLPRQHLLLKHTWFRNDTDVFRSSQLKQYFTAVKEVVFHIPEYVTEYFSDCLHRGEFSWLDKVKKVQVNIMNQNIRLMPPAWVIQELRQQVSLVTMTTAHQQYCTPAYRKAWGIPLHKLSVWISPEKYFFKPYPDKQDLIVVSPDDHPARESIMKQLYSLKNIRVQVIRNLTYEQYKATISEAKWALTFGEGLDGYFIEPILSGAVGFAVYNEEFFTGDFKDLATVYPSYAVMENDMARDLERLDNERDFPVYQRSQFERCAAHYSHEQYGKNIAAFYRGEYTFP
ncbi:MAG: hypothetical protein Q8943_20010, partial [Bacteroidota bacterium]|nr:hypothetical protein [Bacteroidota bacterium]